MASLLTFSVASLYPIVHDLTDVESHYSGQGSSYGGDSSYGGTLNSSSFAAAMTCQSDSAAAMRRHLIRELSQTLGQPSTSSPQPASTSATVSGVPTPRLKKSSSASASSWKRKRRLLQLSSKRSTIEGDAATQATATTTTLAQQKQLKAQEQLKKFEESYVLTRRIFRCVHSSVWECVHRTSGRRFCVKIIDLFEATDDNVENNINLVLKEVTLLQACQGHGSIVRLREVLKQLHPQEKHRNKVYLVMDIMAGGNLYSRVKQQGRLPEEQVKAIAVSILRGLKYMHHERSICHNDLQPANILLGVSDFQAKIADFGSAIRLSASGVARPTGAVGSSSYAAPEVINGQACTFASDMWSVGVILYFCLFGHVPFAERRKSTMELFASDWNHHFASRESKQFLSALIHIDPSVRLTAEEALEHPWLASEVQQQVQEQAQREMKREHVKSCSVPISFKAIRKRFVFHRRRRSDLTPSVTAETTAIF